MTRGSLGIKINAKVSFRVSDGTLQAETQHYKGGDKKDIEGYNQDVKCLLIIANLYPNL